MEIRDEDIMHEQYEDFWLEAAYEDRYADDDPDPYSGTYSEM